MREHHPESKVIKIANKNNFRILAQQRPAGFGGLPLNQKQFQWLRLGHHPPPPRAQALGARMTVVTHSLKLL